MNNTLLILPALLVLTACGPKVITALPSAPRCPDLPVSVTMKQPPLEDITDRSMGAMAIREVDLTARVAIVQNQRDTSIATYAECQATQDAYNAEVIRLQEEASKRKRR